MPVEFVHRSARYAILELEISQIDRHRDLQPRIIGRTEITAACITISHIASIGEAPPSTIIRTRHPLYFQSPHLPAAILPRHAEAAIAATAISYYHLFIPPDLAAAPRSRCDVSNRFYRCPATLKVRPTSSQRLSPASGTKSRVSTL
jgi:hypothetical protein